MNTNTLKPINTSGNSIIELQDNNGEYHIFHILHNDYVIAYGTACNTGFMQDGYIVKDECFSLDEHLQALIEDLECMVNSETGDNSGNLELIQGTHNDLEIVEEQQDDNGKIASEKQLSEMWDSLLEEMPDFPLDDGPAFREGFNNWADSLCKDGELHGLQYHEYCYVGKHSQHTN